MRSVTSPEEIELRRFFIAGKAYQNETGKPVFMPSCLIDEAWHSMINEADRYHEMTTSATECTIQHLESKGMGEIEWVSYYEKMFGKLPKSWFTSQDGHFNSQSYSEYLRKGKMYASWDCSPGYTPIKIEHPVVKKKVAVC